MDTVSWTQRVNLCLPEGKWVEALGEKGKES